MKTVVILGAGPAGCAAAHQIRLGLPDWKVILIEKAPFIGAGARTMFYAGHPYTFGPRHFLTKNEKVWEYMNKYCPLRDCGDHEFKTFVEKDNAFYNFPIHEDDIERMPKNYAIKSELKFLNNTNPDRKPENLEEFWKSSVGLTLYNKMIGPYSEKMWQMSAKELDTFNWSPKGAMIKSGPKAAWANALSGYPIAQDGYNSWFDRCVEGCEVILNDSIWADLIYKETTGRKDYNFLIEHGKYGWSAIYADVIVNTISLDSLYNNSTIGMLPYIGRDFYKFVLPIEFALPEHVYFTYEGGKEPWTRLTEYKKFTRHESPHTLLSIEIPSSNGRHYPIPTKAAQAQARKYIDLLSENVYTIGRHGTYRYEVDIAVCIEQAMALVEKIKSGWDHPVPLERFR